METRRVLAAVVAVLSVGLLVSTQAHAQTVAASRSGVKVQPRFFNPFAVQNNVLTINAFGQIRSTPFSTQAGNGAASLIGVGQASALASAAASQGNGPPLQTPGNGPPFRILPPFRPQPSSPFQPPGPPFDPPGPPFDPPGPPPVVPPPFQ